jgi:hypothetical protein
VVNLILDSNQGMLRWISPSLVAWLESTCSLSLPLSYHCTIQSTRKTQSFELGSTNLQQQSSLLSTAIPGRHGSPAQALVQRTGSYISDARIIRCGAVQKFPVGRFQIPGTLPSSVSSTDSLEIPLRSETS